MGIQFIPKVNHTELSLITSKYSSVDCESISACIFCEILKKNSETYFETPNFLVMPNPHYIVLGHMMIASKAHYGCAGELPPELFEEFVACHTFIHNKIKKNMNIDPIFYEHGRAGSCLSFSEEGAICEHMHCHVLPIDVNISDSILDNLKCCPINISGIKEQFDKYGSYLFFRNKNGGRYFILDDVKLIPPHYLATLIATAAHVPDRSDWQTFNPEYDLAKKAFLEIFKD